jgi:hypothetical protein
MTYWLHDRRGQDDEAKEEATDSLQHGLARGDILYCLLAKVAKDDMLTG